MKEKSPKFPNLGDFFIAEPLTCPLRIHSLDRSWKWDGLTDVFNAAKSGRDSFHAHAESGMRDGAILTKFQVPLERLFRQSFLLDTGQQHIMIGDTLRAAADLAISFWSEQIHALADLRTIRPGLHIKSLDCTWITIHEEWLIVEFGKLRLVRRAEVHAPLEFEQIFALRVGLFFVEIDQVFCGIVIGHARERCLDVLQ